MKFRKLHWSELGRPDPLDLAGSDSHPVYVLAENIRSVHNVGAILRTADAIRAEHVWLTGISAPGDHPSVNKSALGAQDTVSWSHHELVAEALQGARAAGCTLVALEQTDRPSPLADLRLEQYPICLVLGNEVDGISQETLDACDLAIELPQFGAKHSLNVSVAFGIAAYDLLRHWQALRERPVVR